MILMQGKGVSKGVISGPICFFQRPDTKISDAPAASVEEEKVRIGEAQEKSIIQLTNLAEKAREEAGDETAILFETHAMFVEDDDYVECMLTALEERGCIAERAVEIAGEEFSAMLAAMDDPYMQARAADIKDVTRRILNNLMGITEGGINSELPVILAADDLAPSETLQLDKSKILGFITQGGSGNSHTAILARTMGIPAICGLGEALRPEYNGREIYIDGETGQAAIEPDDLTLGTFQAKLDSQQEMQELMETMKGQPDVTLDGREMMVYCNIGSPEDVHAVQSNDGQGIGLFRSEFLYLAASDYPSEEDQFQAYKNVAASMGGKRVVIRTLDIGADKQVDYDALQTYPLEQWRGGAIRRIRPSVILLERGQVFNLCGKRFLTMGGASSHDIQDGILEPDDPLFRLKQRTLDAREAMYRVNHLSWWKEELPSEEEYQTARDSLDRAGWEVDYIITHCCPSSVQDVFSGGLFQRDKLTDFLEEVRQRCRFQTWFFGHYHADMDIDEQFKMLYEKIVKLDI